MRIAAARSDCWPAKQAGAKLFVMKSRAVLGVIAALAILTLHVPGRAQVPQDIRFEILRTMIADSAAARTVMPLGTEGVELSQNGEIDEGPNDPEDWPYKTVLDAMNDGWRIIKSPDMTLMMQDEETYGLGCDFVLEKWL